MIHTHELTQDEQIQRLQDAANSHVLLTLHHQGDEGWQFLKSCMLHADREERVLVISYPANPFGAPPEIVSGQSLDVSFRRGQRKWIFESKVAERRQFRLKRSEAIPALSLQWPDCVQEMQRRLYYRPEVPPLMTIPLDLKRNHAYTPNADSTDNHRGLLVNLSEGGMAVAMSTPKGPRWRAGEDVICAFSLGENRAVREITGTIRHCENTYSGQIKLGIQFDRQDSQPYKHQTLKEISRVARQFRDMEIEPVPGGS